MADENTNIDVYRFREIAQSLFKGLNLSDGQILERIEQNRKDLFDLTFFRDRVKATLFETVRKDKYDSPENIPDDDAITFINNLVTQHKRWKRDDEIVGFALDVKQLLIDSVGKNLTDNEAIAEIKRLQKSHVNAEKSLSENGASSDDAIIDSVYELRSERTYYRGILDHLCSRLKLYGADAFEKLKNIEIKESHGSDVCDNSEIAKNGQIERLKHSIEGIASFLDLPTDARQNEICFAIMEPKEAVKKLSKEPLSSTQIIIANLRHDLLIANKVIARLVGE